MQTLLMFVDESNDAKSTYWQISGFYISVQNYIKLRYLINKKHIADNYGDSLEYKIGCKTCYSLKDFCPKHDDQQKIETLKFLFSSIYKYSKLAFCIGVHKSIGLPKDLSQRIAQAPNYNLSQAWFRNLFLMKHIAENNIIIPVIDLGLDNGFKSVYDIYSRMIHQVVSYTTEHGESDTYYKSANNILEPVFSIDEYSVGVQLADVVGGMNLNNSKLSKSHNLSPFKLQMAAITSKYLKNNKTICLFSTPKYDEKKNSGWTEYHNSYCYGEQYSGQSQPPPHRST